MTTLPVTQPSVVAFPGAGPIALFAALLAVALGPILFVDIPAGVDYPNHMARMSILARAGTAAASRYYEVGWGLYPNLAMDLIVPSLARATSVETATRLFYLASQILIVSGAIAIELAVKRRFAIAGFAALLYLYSVPFAFGFVNFQFALGLALWGMAAWIALRDRPLIVRMAVHAPLTAILFVSHLFALGIYGLTLGLVELHGLWQRRDLRHAIEVFAVIAAPALAILPVFLIANGAVGGALTVWHLAVKPRWLVAVNGYSLTLSIVLTAGLVLLVHALGKREALRVQGAAWFLLGGYLVAFLLIPFRLLDTAFADVRMVVVAALVLPAFVTIHLPEPRVRALFTAAGVALVVASLAMAAYAQLIYRRAYAEVVSSFAALPAGAKVLVGAREGINDPPVDLLDYPMFQAPVMAVHYADAFVPSLFTYPGKQPVLPRAHVWRLAAMQGGPEPMALLRAVAHGTTDGMPDYLATWPRDFDYLYVIGAPDGNPLPDLLEETARGQRFALYRIKAPTP